ncbi:MAG: bifunctional diaminohydroxyphosphoribosylaminopyrimidine deaminase/5-amino-6-(5-phosphoribosylamino)uracil reductase RibD [Pirellulales bacterium]|nr:bifunctional diaminohydroxyphosphoribosylaminopyrimidine deaminase/5-amino-6-(5-phosphoribosylamino)uracil reductase RibD [Pirellulales bacterium]
MPSTDLDSWHLRRALELAAQGRGLVEPNPLVGCVIARGAEIVGEGWHRRFGGPHAEVEALRVAGPRAKGASLYVTLEPCCHQGKTPPCTRAILDAGVRRVVAATRDPFPQVAGGGIQQLQAAGLEVAVGVLEEEARDLNAPYFKLVETGRPWVIAKWAMSLDGKIAARSGDSKWISNERSREVVHRLRGRVDGILVGHGTLGRDDPLLTARPPGPRTATRIVLATHAALPPNCQLLQTTSETPVLIAVGPEASPDDCQRLEQSGCEIFVCPGRDPHKRLLALLDELGRRRWTNLLVEGGATVLGSFFDARQIDEVHVFIAPKLIGGESALSPIGGSGIERIEEALPLVSPQVQTLEGDLYVSGRVKSGGQTFLSGK